MMARTLPRGSIRLGDLADVDLTLASNGQMLMKTFEGWRAKTPVRSLTVVAAHTGDASQSEIRLPCPQEGNPCLRLVCSGLSALVVAGPVFPRLSVSVDGGQAWLPELTLALPLESDGDRWSAVIDLLLGGHDRHSACFSQETITRPATASVGRADGGLGRGSPTHLRLRFGDGATLVGGDVRVIGFPPTTARPL